MPHWTPDARSALLALARAVLAHPAWPGVVAAGLAADDTFWMADDLAQHVGVDTFPAILERLRRDPFDVYWWQAMRRTDETRLRELLAIADAHFHRPSSARARRWRRASGRRSAGTRPWRPWSPGWRGSPVPAGRTFAPRSRAR